MNDNLLCNFYYFTENGWRNIRFHVDANLHYFSADDEKNIRKTVAYIVGCSIEDVQINGYLKSSSFFVVLAIKDIYVEKLLNMKLQDKDKLRKLSINYFEVGLKPIKLEPTAGENWFYF